MSDLPGVERCQQGIVVDQRSTSGVDHKRAFWHQRQRFGVERVFRGRCVGQEQHGNFSAAQRLAQPGIAMQAGYAGDHLGVPRPACHLEAKGQQRLCTGGA